MCQEDLLGVRQPPGLGLDLDRHRPAVDARDDVWCAKLGDAGLTEKGLSREEAYRIVQGISMRVWQGQGEFKELLLGDPEVGKYLTKSEIEECFDYQTYLKNIDSIFIRVFDE